MNSTDAEKRKQFMVHSITAMCAVYRVEPATVLLPVWLKAISDLRVEVLIAGLELVFKRHKEFMPSPAEFRECCEEAASRMQWAPEPIERQIRRNVLDEVRDIALEMYPSLALIDAVKDAKKLEKLMRHANIVRYLRMGIEPAWIPYAELEPLRKFARRES